MAWAFLGLVLHGEQHNQPNRARQDQRRRSGGAEAGVADDFIFGERLPGCPDRKSCGILTGRRIQAVEFGAGPVVLETRGFEDAQRPAQFGTDIAAIPVPVVDLVNLLGVITESVDGLTTKFGEPLGFILLAFERQEAAGMALLLSVPALACASILEGLGLADAPSATSITDLLWAGGIAALAGYFSIAFLMRWLETGKYGIFVAYRLLVGGALLYLLYFRAA